MVPNTKNAPKQGGMQDRGIDTSQVSVEYPRNAIFKFAPSCHRNQEIGNARDDLTLLLWNGRLMLVDRHSRTCAINIIADHGGVEVLNGIESQE